MTNLLSIDCSIQKWLTAKNIFLFFPKHCHNRLSHYQILELNEDCTSKEIRNAFIKLSKESHPDGNITDNSRHTRFVLINEAYTVLIKKETRASYDHTLRMQRSTKFNESINRRFYYPDTSPTPKYGANPDDLFSYYRKRAQDKRYNSRPYYGIPGVKRIHNKYIASGCVFFLLLSSVTFVFATKGFAQRRKEAIAEMNARNYEYYNSVKHRASENGMDEQINQFKQKLDDFNERGLVYIKRLD